MIEGKTTSGFEYQIPDSVGDDFEVLECMSRLQKNDILAVVELIDLVFGVEQKNAFKEHCRDENGKVSTERMITEFFDIFSNNAATKK